MTHLSVADLIFLALTSYGLCFILMYGEILNYFRERLVRIKFFNQLLSCALCTGFWCGAVLIPFTNCILTPLFSSCVCYFLHLIKEILCNKAYPDI